MVVTRWWWRKMSGDPLFWALLLFANESHVEHLRFPLSAVQITILPFNELFVHGEVPVIPVASRAWESRDPSWMTRGAFLLHMWAHLNFQNSPQKTVIEFWTKPQAKFTATLPGWKQTFVSWKRFKSWMWTSQQKLCTQPLAPTIADSSPHMLHATFQTFSKRHSSPNPWRSFVLIRILTLKKPPFPGFLAASTWRLLHRWHPSNGRQPRRQQHHPTSKALWANLTKNSYLSNATNRKFDFAKTKRKFIDSNHWFPKLLLWASRGVNALMEKVRPGLTRPVLDSQFAIDTSPFSIPDSRFSVFVLDSRFAVLESILSILVSGFSIAILIFSRHHWPWHRCRSLWYFRVKSERLGGLVLPPQTYLQHAASCNTFVSEAIAWYCHHRHARCPKL